MRLPAGILAVATLVLPAIAIAQGAQPGANSSATVTATTTGGTSLDCSANATGTCVKVSGAAGHQSVSDGTNYIRINSAGNGSVVVNTGNGGSVNPAVDNQVDNGIAAGAWKISRSYAYNSPATSGVQFACTGAAACQMTSASGQALTLDTGGGTSAVNLGTTNATSVSIGKAGVTTSIGGTLALAAASRLTIGGNPTLLTETFSGHTGLSIIPGTNGANGGAFNLYPQTTVTSNNVLNVFSDSGATTLVASVDYQGNIIPAPGAGYKLNGGQFAIVAGAGMQMTPGQNTAAGPAFYLYPNTTVTSGNLLQLAASNTGSPIVAQVDFAGNVNIASGASYKINNVALPTSTDWTYTGTIAAGLASGALIGKTTAVNAGTFRNATLVSSTVGVGGGNYVWKICSDGITCAAGNTYATCTVSCTAAANTVTACTAGAATAVAAAGTVAWSLTTACTSNPVGQASAQFTNP